MKYLIRKLILTNIEGKDIVLPLSVMTCAASDKSMPLKPGMNLLEVSFYKFEQEEAGVIYIDTLHLAQKKDDTYTVIG